MPSPLLVATSIAAALMAGLLPALLSGLKEPLQQRLDVPEPRVVGLTKWLFLFWIPLMPLAGLIVDRWGIQRSLFWGSGALACAVCWLGLRQSYVSALWGVLGMAAAG